MLIPVDDSVRLLSQKLEGLNYSKLYQVYSVKGRKPAVDPKIMFKVLTYAYMNGIYTTHKIEIACSRDINFLWLLAGNKAPDHATVARFRQKYLAEALDDLFYQMVNELYEMGEILFENVFIDGTKIETNAIWPDKLPEGFDPVKAMDIGRDPGLGIRALQEKGITGKRVNVAMIDNTLHLEHIEFGNQVKYYGVVDNVEPSASMHGPCIASLCVGKTCGVAPGASLYFMGNTNADFTETSFITGLYAMACQVKPDITPELLWETALKTGEKKEVAKGDQKYPARMINPEKLIERLQ